MVILSKFLANIYIYILATSFICADGVFGFVAKDCKSMMECMVQARFHVASIKEVIAGFFPAFGFSKVSGLHYFPVVAPYQK